MIENLLNLTLIDGLEVALLALALGSLRLIPILILFPPFNMASLSVGLVRSGIVLGLSVFYFPNILAVVIELKINGNLYNNLLWLLPKEIFIGLLVALVMSLPFWIAFSSGAFVDNQSGAQLGEMIDPGTREEATANASFFQLIMLALVLQANVFVLLATEILPESYEVWPLLEALPAFTSQSFRFFFELLGFVLSSALIIVGPFVAGLLMLDLGLAYLSRFVPSQNPFFLSMSGKIAFVVIFSVLYHRYLVSYLSEFLSFFRNLQFLGTGG